VDVAAIDIPVIVLQGSADLMVPYAHGEWLAANVASARPHLLAGEGHLSLIHHVGPLLGELRSWLGD
jgi:pimeloyl-ACP methyl ester carboxylesterase